MITFSDKQLKILEMSKPVYLVTVGMSKFGSTDTLARSWFNLKQEEALWM
jgi:hypothetical protein